MLTTFQGRHYDLSSMPVSILEQMLDRVIEVASNQVERATGDGVDPRVHALALAEYEQAKTDIEAALLGHRLATELQAQAEGEATALSPLTILLPTNPVLLPSCVSEQRGAVTAAAPCSFSAVSHGAFAILAEVAQEHGDKIAVVVQRLLAQHGVVMPDLVYADIKRRLKKGLAISRFEEGWGIFLDGGVQWPTGYGQPFTVVSRSLPGEEYRVYLAVAQGHRRQWQCECRDHYGHADKLASGFCAHILGALVLFLAGMMLVEGRKQGPAQGEQKEGEEAA